MLTEISRCSASTRRPEGTSASRAHDEKISVVTEDAYSVCAEVLGGDGLLVGHSAGAVLWAAREVARRLRSGVVVALLPDGGERYLGGGRPGGSGRSR